MNIREINSTCAAEITLVAQRMLDTLMEIEGPERGAAIHSLQWLEDRVRWHLDPAMTTAQVLVAVGPGRAIIGHSIFRIESPDLDPFGLIATTYVVPSSRKSGWAATFLDRAHTWFRDQGISVSCTWTSGSNTPLISLYERFGYTIVDHGPNNITGTPMVKLAVHLGKCAT
jgi:GNAT superfamily N-acetyltransferase